MKGGFHFLDEFFQNSIFWTIFESFPFSGRMSTRCDASCEASNDVRHVLADNVGRAAHDRTIGGSGAALASALRAALLGGVSWRNAPRVFELGGGGQCFARVLALHVYGHAGDDAVVRLRRALANALVCERIPGASGEVRCARSTATASVCAFPLLFTHVRLALTTTTASSRALRRRARA